jgi:hypothetical protein
MGVGAALPPGITQYQFYKRLREFQGCCGQVQKTSLPRNLIPGPFSYEIPN